MYMRLNAFADQTGIVPLFLWQAVYNSKRLRGITLPFPVRSEGQLLFDSQLVRQCPVMCNKRS